MAEIPFVGDIQNIIEKKRIEEAQKLVSTYDPSESGAPKEVSVPPPGPNTEASLGSKAAYAKKCFVRFCQNTVIPTIQDRVSEVRNAIDEKTVSVLRSVSKIAQRTSSALRPSEDTDVDNKEANKQILNNEDMEGDAHAKRAPIVSNIRTTLAEFAGHVSNKASAIGSEIEQNQKERKESATQRPELPSLQGPNKDIHPNNAEDIRVAKEKKERVERAKKRIVAEIKSDDLIKTDGYEINKDFGLIVNGNEVVEIETANGVLIPGTYDNYRNEIERLEGSTSVQDQMQAAIYRRMLTRCVSPRNFSPGDAELKRKMIGDEIVLTADGIESEGLKNIANNATAMTAFGHTPETYLQKRRIIELLGIEKLEDCLENGSLNLNKINELAKRRFPEYYARENGLIARDAKEEDVVSYLAAAAIEANDRGKSLADILKERKDKQTKQTSNDGAPLATHSIYEQARDAGIFDGNATEEDIKRSVTQMSRYDEYQGMSHEQIIEEWRKRQLESPNLRTGVFNRLTEQISSPIENKVEKPTGLEAATNTLRNVVQTIRKGYRENVQHVYETPQPETVPQAKIDFNKMRKAIDGLPPAYQERFAQHIVELIAKKSLVADSQELAELIAIMRPTKKEEAKSVAAS